MDRVFCTIIVATAVVLMYMSYVEMMKMKTHPSSDKCGSAPSDAKTVIPDTSAKRSLQKSVQQIEDETNNYMSVEESWPIEESPCKHNELEQDEEVLKESFGNFLEDVESSEKSRVVSQFSTSTPNTETVKTKSNIRPISQETAAETPTYTRNLGLKHPILSMFHRDHNDKKVQHSFGEHSSWFGGTDSYYSARQEAALD